MAEDVKVPMEILAPYIEEWLALGYSQADLAQLSGVPARRIYCIRKGYDADSRGRRHHHVTFTTADKLMAAMDMWDRWYDELREFYELVS